MDLGSEVRKLWAVGGVIRTAYSISRARRTDNLFGLGVGVRPDPVHFSTRSQSSIRTCLIYHFFIGDLLPSGFPFVDLGLASPTTRTGVR